MVTGGLGLIGHNVVQRLTQQGHNVVVVDNLTNYNIIPLDEHQYIISERKKKIQNALILNVDITDAAKMEDLFSSYNFSCVIHLASFPRQKVVNSNPAAGARVMVEGLLNLLELSVKHGVHKFVYTSSSMVYGDFNHCIKEHESCKPQGQYGIMKYAGEKLIEDYHRRTGINYTIIRPSAVYGPLDVEDRVVSKFILTAMRGGALRVRGENEMLDFTFVDDAADGIVAASTITDTNNKIYNITKGASKTLLEAAKLAIQIVGQGSIILESKDQDFPSRAALDITQAKTDFGYDPRVDVEQGFVEYYKWFKDSPFWQSKIGVK